MVDPLSRRKSGYISSLDGWRAVAILGVMIYHSGPFVVGGVSLFPVQMLGRFGVQLFFAISGILICTRLLDEEDQRGRISLRAFYQRRLFRIQPAALMFLGVALLLAFSGVIPLDPKSFWTALLSVRNYYDAGDAPGNGYTAHFWSLAVEEHFYLILPFLLLLLRGRHRVVWFGVITVLSILWTFHVSHGADLGPKLWHTDFQISWLFVPSWLALMVRLPSVRTVFVKYLPSGPIVWIGVCGTLVLGLRFHNRFLFPFLVVWLSLMVFSTIFHPESWSGRFLELYPLRAIGRISFSLYLWQQLFCRNLAESTPESTWLGSLQHRPQSFLLPFVFAVLSYFLVEKPMIRLGHQLSPPVTAGHEDLSSPPLGEPSTTVAKANL